MNLNTHFQIIFSDFFYFNSCLKNLNFFVKKLCKNIKIDFVRARDPYVSGMLGLIIAKSLKCKLCISR